MENKIKKVTLYYDNEMGKYTSLVVSYEDKTEKTITNDDDDNFKKNYSLVKQELQKTYSLDVNGLKEKGYIVLENAKKKNKYGISNLTVNKKAIRTLAVGLALVVGSSFVGYYYGIRNNKNSNNVNSTNRIESTPTPTPIPTKTPTAEPTLEPFVEVNVPFISNEFDDSVDFNSYGYKQDSVIALKVSKDGNLKHIYTESNYQGDWYDLSRESTNELYSSVFNNSKPEDAILMYYQYLFEDEDRIFIEYLTKMRNKIVETLLLNDTDIAREYINKSVLEIVKYVCFNEPLKVVINNQDIEINYDSLSSEAQRAVLELSEEMVIALNNDNFEYNGQVYDINSLLGQDGLLIAQIRNYKHSK